MSKKLVIIGAGPYGLSAAGYAAARGVDCAIFGTPMEFWTRNMPKGMFLRSGIDWHFDVLGQDTFEAFCAVRGLDASELGPIPLELYTEYGHWFQERKGLRVDARRVVSVEHSATGLEVLLDDGERLAAQNVLVACGFAPFQNIPDELVRGLPPERYSHTCELRDLDFLAAKRCAIIGGRQSAFETAALARERGASEVHVIYRHGTPAFEQSDWSWVDDMVRVTVDSKGWFRSLPAEEKERIWGRFWAEGRLRLEPWLAPRIDHENVRLHPQTAVVEQVETKDRVVLTLTSGESIAVDFIVFATGYRVDMGKISYLSRDTIVPRLEVSDGFPVLDESFQSSVPGLFIAGLPATKDFGPFFGFVRGCPAAARLIVDRIARDEARAANP